MWHHTQDTKRKQEYVEAVERVWTRKRRFHRRISPFCFYAIEIVQVKPKRPRHNRIIVNLHLNQHLLSGRLLTQKSKTECSADWSRRCGTVSPTGNQSRQKQNR